MQKVRFFVFICSALIANVVFAAPNFPELTDRVVDEVGILSTDRKQNIITKLADFEQKSTAQIVVAVVSSLEGYEIRDYGYQLARHWQLGQKDVNNGVLLLVAPNERKVSIEVGYGLEGSLTDALSFEIIQHYILPKFKASDMEAGIELGVDMILQGLVGEISAESLMAQNPTEMDIPIELIIFSCFFVFVLVVIIIQAVRGVGSNGSGNYSSSSSNSRSSWGSGSSSGGSSFGGGGGSFGGGGASGGW